MIPAATAAIAVKSTTGVLTAAGVWAGLVTVVGMIIVAYIRQWGPWKDLDNKREANLLTERAEEMEAMRARMAKLEAKLEQKDALHQAERAVDRHRINNLNQCFTAFLTMVKKDPNDAARIAVLVEEMRADQLKREAQEAADIHKAVIAAAFSKDAGE